MPDYVHILRIEPHPGNIRADPGDLTELADSIRSQGILQPVVVQPSPRKHGMFTLIAGHRRLAAARLAGLEKIPVEIRQAAGPDQATILMLVENCQRAGLTAVEKAEAMGRLRKLGYTHARIARATGLSAATVSYFLALLELDDASRARVASGTVAVGEAIGAVKAARATTRRRNGHAPRKVNIGEEHFSYKHPLADDVRLACSLAGHAGRKYGRDRSRTEGKIGCGECWEAAIREDERARVTAVPRA